MSDSIFIQKTELFAYSGTNCIRNDYYYNACQKCLDICPEDAFHIVRNKLTLFSNECISCGACMGSCPTEALTLLSFDTNAFVSSFKEREDKLLSCKKSTSCLGSFDAQHYIAMALTSEEMPQCDMTHCQECALNKGQKVEGFIRGEINKANEFLLACGTESSILTLDEKAQEENAKRMIFKAAVKNIKEASQEENPKQLSMTLEYQKNPNKSGVPLKFMQLKNALKENLPKIKVTKHATNFNLFSKKEISFEACTNCGDCIRFCPTEALLNTLDKQGINFNVGNCIGCGICEHICKTDAIKTTQGIDLVEFAYDRGQELVHYEMVMCHECRCPYPYRGGDPICDRCADYRVDFSHVFTLAKDM